jgi:hypothetical protein
MAESAPARETIFDHQVTASEQAVILPFPMSKAKWLELEKDQDSEYAHIFDLYSLRGDKVKAAEYRAKLADPEYARTRTVEDTLP